MKHLRIDERRLTDFNSHIVESKFTEVVKTINESKVTNIDIMITVVTAAAASLLPVEVLLSRWEVLVVVVVSEALI